MEKTNLGMPILQLFIINNVHQLLAMQVLPLL
jgi:hypothetical protein